MRSSCVKWATWSETGRRPAVTVSPCCRKQPSLVSDTNLPTGEATHPRFCTQRCQAKSAGLCMRPEKGRAMGGDQAEGLPCAHCCPVPNSFEKHSGWDTNAQLVPGLPLSLQPI